MTKVMHFWIALFCSLSFAGFANEQKRDVFGVLIQISNSNVDMLRKNKAFIQLKSQYRFKEKRYFSIAEVLVLDSPVETNKSELLDACAEIAKLKFVTLCELNLRLKPQGLKETIGCETNLPLPSVNLGNISSVLEQQCLFPPLVEGEDWDVFWAQHMVGADLLREELEKSGVKENDNPASIIGIWDSIRDSHGDQVSQIIAGPKLSAVIPSIMPIAYQELQSGDNYIQNYEALYEECRQNRNCPSYINNSMNWHDSRILANLASSMSDQGSTIVTSANNDWAELSLAKTTASLNKKIIVVASLTPIGTPSDFTNYGEGVTISAPADNSIRSYDFEGNAKDFGGTSGATPLVTGTLGGFTLLSRHHLSTRQADLLLRKTAIPLPHLPNNHFLGAGMLNSYKIGLVALRIKEQCRRYPEGVRKDECLSDTLENDETYQFDETSTRLFNEAMESFPECLSPQRKPKESINDCERTEAFNNLRRASLLNPTDARVLNAVICVKERHFEGNGTDFYRSLAERLQKGDDEIIADMCRNEGQVPLIKYLPSPVRLDFITLDFIRQNQCSLGSIEVVLESLLERSPSEEVIELILTHPKINGDTLGVLSRGIADNIEKLSNPQELLEKILAHPKINGNILGTLSRGVASNTEEFSNPQELLEKILTHSKINGDTLEGLSHGIANNAEEFSNPQELLERILAHPKINEYSLGALSRGVSNNAEKLSNPQELLEKILAHPKINEYSLGALSRGIADNTEKLSNPQELLEKILAHPKINGLVLQNLFPRVVNNAKKLSNLQRLVEKIIAHPKINEYSLGALSREIADNTEKLSNPQELFEKILAHPKINESALGALSREIADNTEKLSNPQELFEKILAHPKINGDTLEALSRGVANNAEEFSNHQELFEKILAHPKINGDTLEALSRGVANNAEEFSNRQELFEKILAHPKINGDTLEELSRGVANNAEKLSNPQELFEKILVHPKINEYVLEELSRGVSNNAEKLSNPQELLEKIEERRRSVK